MVVTDHNSHEGIDQARAELASMREQNTDGFRELVLFSGVELTVDGGYHLLGVFGPDTPSEDINALLHVCGYTAQRGSSLGTTRMSFAEVVQTIVERGGLAIPAHADASKGLFEHDRRNQEDLVQSRRIVAVETVTDPGSKRAADLGWVRVLGSDAHHLDDAGCPEGMEAKYPGSHFTWVKMETPDLFGIKLALSDGEQSVLPTKAGELNPNDFSHSVIDQVVVRKGNSEATYKFGPWMNTIIGGRGVGKSTIIELLRLAMGRFSDLPSTLQEDSEWFSPWPGRNTTSRFWDRDTRIEVHLRRLEQQYRVVWQGSTPATSVIEILQGKEWKKEGGSPRDRFPLLINSQKQIYETARDPQSLLKAIDDQPSIGYVTWKETFDELCGEYRTHRAAIKELQIKIDSEDRVRGKLSDVVAGLAQIAKLRDSDEARELDRLTQEEQRAIRKESLATTFEASVAKLIDEYRDLEDSQEDGPQAEELWEAEQARRNSVVQAYSAIDDAVQVLKASREIWGAVESGSPRHLRMEELNQYLSQGTDQGASGLVEGLGDPNEANARLLVEKSDLEASLADIRKARTKQLGLVSDAEETLGKITEHRSELTVRRAALVSQLSSDDLKIQVLAQADDTLLEADLRRLVQKSNSFDSVFSSDGLPGILGHPFRPKRDVRVASLKTLLKEIRANGSEAPSLEKSLKTAIDQRFFTHVKLIDEHTYQTEIDLWFPEDRLRVQYKQDGVTSFRELGEGSPGEKTAALLAVILQLSNDPLLLDQPEDDLDNKLIYDLVVATLKRIKTNRQVIVVTHNANVVVNADAEHVTILRHGTMPDVEAHGSIQEATIKQSICLIMEGGKPAFEARYKRLMN
ncbi:hypothetical protein AYX19_16040 [Paenarthrobacter ureafaciens]|nr:hypothetical protein AYX19_16040 [Paenarthrobacter ureafaciens]